MATVTYDIINPDGSRTTVTETLLDSVVNQQTIQQQAAAALVNNRTYLAVGSPTTAQITAQVRALTQQNQGIIRSVLQQFDATN